MFRYIYRVDLVCDNYGEKLGRIPRMKKETVKSQIGLIDKRWSGVQCLSHNVIFCLLQE